MRYMKGLVEIKVKKCKTWDEKQGMNSRELTRERYEVSKTLGRKQRHKDNMRVIYIDRDSRRWIL